MERLRVLVWISVYLQIFISSDGWFIEPKCQQWCYRRDVFGVYLKCCSCEERFGACPKGCLFDIYTDTRRLSCLMDQQCPMGYKCCNDDCSKSKRICKPIQIDIFPPMPTTTETILPTPVFLYRRNNKRTTTPDYKDAYSTIFKRRSKTTTAKNRNRFENNGNGKMKTTEVRSDRTTVLPDIFINSGNGNVQTSETGRETMTKIPREFENNFGFERTTVIGRGITTEIPRVFEDNAGTERIKTTVIGRETPTEIPRDNNAEIERITTTVIGRETTTKKPRVFEDNFRIGGIKTTVIGRETSTNIPRKNNAGVERVRTTIIGRETTTTEIPRVYEENFGIEGMKTTVIGGESTTANPRVFDDNFGIEGTAAKTTTNNPKVFEDHEQRETSEISIPITMIPKEFERKNPTKTTEFETEITTIIAKEFNNIGVTTEIGTTMLLKENKINTSNTPINTDDAGTKITTVKQENDNPVNINDFDMKITTEKLKEFGITTEKDSETPNRQFDSKTIPTVDTSTARFHSKNDLDNYDYDPDIDRDNENYDSLEYGSGSKDDFDLDNDEDDGHQNIDDVIFSVEYEYYDSDEVEDEDHNEQHHKETIDKAKINPEVLLPTEDSESIFVEKEVEVY